MRKDSPAVYVCPASKDRGMHYWSRTENGARCKFCETELTGEDADEVFRGAQTPLGQVRRPA